MKNHSAVTRSYEGKRIRTFPFLERYSLHWVHVVFGSPERNCAGSGICRATEIKPSARFSNSGITPCQGAIAKVKALETGQLVFYFLLASMCSQRIQQYVFGKSFLVETNAIIDLSVRGQTVRYVIAEGTYPIIRSREYLIVHFQRDG